MEETKAERKARKSALRFKREQEKLSSQGIEVPPLNVLCVRFGNKYSQEYVVRLRNMVKRHLTIPYKFYCLTDDPKPLEGVELIVQNNAGYVKGWWHKVHMFDPKLPITGRILYMDLDVIVCNRIDKLVTVWPHDFLGIRDFNRKFHPAYKYLNSSVMSWIAGTQSYIFENFKNDPSSAMRMPGDQDWTWKCAKDKIKFWPDNWIQSYKWEIRSRDELVLKQGHRLFRDKRDDIVIDPDCCIAVFHGDPNPAHVDDKFVVDNWK
jgi:hypothetical protein